MGFEQAETQQAAGQNPHQLHPPALRGRYLRHSCRRNRTNGRLGKEVGSERADTLNSAVDPVCDRIQFSGHVDVPALKPQHQTEQVDLKQIGESMTPDSSAFLLLVEDVESEAVVDSMKGYNANVVTLTVGDELSGEIASYVAGEATDDQGNVVAGEAGVAADADGDVVAAGEVAAGTTN